MRTAKKTKRIRSRSFLTWAKTQAGPCCLCHRIHGTLTQGSELHHFGERGLGTKGSDYAVARVCPACHTFIQGKGRLWAVKNHDWEPLAALQEDALELVSGWAAALEGLDIGEDEPS